VRLSDEKARGVCDARQRKEVDRIDRGGVNPHQQAIVGDGRLVDLLEPQNVRAPVRAANDCSFGREGPFN